MAANSSIQLTNLDFDTLKGSLLTFLQSQDTFKDYNFEGSALNTLVDLLTYNTQYNAYYLNMVANEMFLDSSIQRNSVISHAKLLNYVPKSSRAPQATINLKINNVTDSSLTLPKFTHFLSEAIDGVNYNFVTTDSYTVNVSANTAIFNDVTLRQGLTTTKNFTVDSTANPKYIFEIPDSNVDTTTIQVAVQDSSTNTSYSIYNLATDFLSLDGSSLVYFLQESLSNTYEIYFGDDILGKKLSDGNIVKVSYLITNGTSSAGANNFVLMDSVSGYSNNVIYPVTSATQGGDKETIESIKYHAPKSYSAQNRAVTKDDYTSIIYRMSSKFGSIKRANVVRDNTSFKRNLNIYVVSENNVGFLSTTPITVKENLKTWLNHYRMINDTIDILDGKVVNFGIEFELISKPEANSTDVLNKAIKVLKDYYANKLLIGVPFYISEIYQLLNDIKEVVDTKNVKIINKFGTGYSDTSYDIESNISADGRFIFVPEDTVLELRYPNLDIVGVVL